MPTLINPYRFIDTSTFIGAITSLVLTTNLKLCLDASDINSYASGQSWLDVSGNGYDFFRGTTSASQSSDPTHNGTPGGKSSSEYWSFDGGDRFTYDSTNETWMNALHKNSAAFTFVAWVYLGGTSAGQRLLSTIDNIGTDTGISIFFNSSGSDLALNVANSGSDVLGGTVNISSSETGAWRFVAISADEAAGSFKLQNKASQATVSATYSSPSSSNASSTFTIGADGDGTQPLASGSRLACLAAWDRALSLAEIDSLYQLTKAKFGL